MKNLYIISLLFLMTLTAHSQDVLTVKENGLMAGDSSLAREITFTDPGPSGDGMMWDFTGIVYTGKSHIHGVKTNPEYKSTDPDGVAMIFSEGGYDYNYTLNNGCYIETGYINREKRMTLTLSDPIERFRLPLTYGQETADSFAGVAWYNEKSRIDLSGRFSLKADARGTLLLPDRIMTDVMRVTTVKNSLQIGVCGTTGVETRHYSWYAPGFRYPVVTITETAYRYPGKDPVYQRSAFINLSQAKPSAPAMNGGSAGKSAQALSNTVTVSPNPFSEGLTFRYFLTNECLVSIELFDMTGKLITTPVSHERTAGGVHSGTLNAIHERLKPGMYYLRFTFGSEVIVKKVVKV